MQLFNTISNNRIVNKHGLKIAWAIAAVCLLLLLVNIALNVKAQSDLKVANYAVKPVLTSKQNNRPSYRASDIVRANLFGDPSPKPVVKNAPKTTLDLTLQGILWASDNSMGRAIIMAGKKASKLYSIGDSIEGAGASIKEIRDGEVILDRNGASESLPLVKKTSSGNRQLITYSSAKDKANQVVSSLTDGANGVVSPRKAARTESTRSPRNIARSSSRPRSQNGKNRKVRKPNFSGLDKALKKMGEL